VLVRCVVIGDPSMVRSERRLVFMVTLGRARHAGPARLLVVEDERRLADLKDGLTGEELAVDLAHDGGRVWGDAPIVVKRLS
jgi:hypothetical protein